MKKRNLFILIILILIIIILGCYIYYQNKEIKKISSRYEVLQAEVNNNRTALNGVYELGINVENYEADTSGIVRNYDEYLKLKEQYQIINFSNENILEGNFMMNDYIYYLFEFDKCKEEITGYDIEIVEQNVDIKFYVESKCGICGAVPILYFIPVSKDTISNEFDINVDYEYKYDRSCWSFELPASIDKPILYLYPEYKTKVTVQLEKANQIITSYPKYNNGWEVVASPNGDLFDQNGKYYYALYWDEYNINKVDFNEGFYVTKDDAINFLEEKLSIIGLNDKERNEFIMYWLPKLENNEQSLVYFELTEERESNNKLIISPAPDSLLRINMHIKKVNKKINIKEQKLNSFERVGFSAVEWGGTIH